MLDQRILRLLPFLASFITLSVVALGLILYGPDVHSLRVANLDLGHFVPSWWNTPSEDSSALRPGKADPKGEKHPIIDLIRKADEEFNHFLEKETKDLASAAQRYRERRGRHPPPGFDKWWQYAKENNAIMVEDFWDQIYHDIHPLWALNQSNMLDMVRGHDRIFRVRDGKATLDGDHFWMPIWQDLINDVAENLPDMDIAVNTMDEPRLLIPFEDMEGYVKKELDNRKVVDYDDVKMDYSPFVEASKDFVPPDYPWNRSQPIWPRAAAVCPPSSEARLAPIQTDYSQPPHLSLEHTLLHTTSGYVSNYTLSTSICHQPDLQGLHGFFIQGISASTGPNLFPLFGSSKILQNSEILIPPAMYYKGDTRFTITAPPVPWAEKTTSLIWRGLASGGRNTEDNWKGFHRHRLVSMLNGTQAIAYPNNSNFIDIATLPLETYNLHSLTPPSTSSSSPLTTTQKARSLGTWLQTFSDCAFNDLACFPRVAPPPDGLTCSYTDYLFHPAPGIPLEEQHKSKYLIDVDGNSFSGRYRDFLRSGSLPIKGTLFREWHDSRLVAWKHFVPMDNRFLDVFGILEFFVGFDEGEGEGFENPHSKDAAFAPPIGQKGSEKTTPLDFDPEKQAKENDLVLPPDTAESRRSLPRSSSSHNDPREKPATLPLNAKYPNNHDTYAQKIAEEGRDWAEKVLRVEDMRIYTYRLLLEYARVMDPERDVLGWIGDLGMGGG